MPQFMDPDYLIDTFGLIGLLAIIFAECGLLVGFFLPGDTLLFTAGLLVSNDILHAPLWAILLGTPIAAVIGNVVGYWIGYRAGPAVFDRPDSKLFKHEHVEKAQVFFDKYGPLTIVLARFVPVLRTFVTVMAGASRMRFSIYLLYSVIGGIVWCIGVTIAGYYLGQIDFIAEHVELILILGVVGAVCVTALPVIWRMVHNRKQRQAAEAAEAVSSAD